LSINQGDWTRSTYNNDADNQFNDNVKLDIDGPDELGNDVDGDLDVSNDLDDDGLAVAALGVVARVWRMSQVRDRAKNDEDARVAYRGV
jgi:hypothetical protein